MTAGGMDGADCARFVAGMRFRFAFALLLLIAAPTCAQTPLGVGTYTETFDALQAGLSAGWSVRTGASASTLGTDAGGTSFAPTATSWGSSTGNFRNVASALNPGATLSDSTAVQAAYSNRALGLRQTSSFGDPGAAITFNFSTNGLSVNSISFSAQLLSVQSYSTIWLLQCATGSNPSAWTTLAAFNDPDAFSATTVTAPAAATLGPLLNNQSSAWLRVVALSAATGTGSRDTFAIDNFTIVTTAAVPPAIFTPPASQTITAFQSATFAVAATGVGTLSYQWRKSTHAIAGAIGPTYTLTGVMATDAGSYDVTVTDANGSTTSSAATLTVNKAPAVVTLGSLAHNFDGSAHAASATTTPANLAVSFSYNGSSSAPTDAGSYPVVGTVNDANFSGTANSSLVIARGAQTVVFPAPGTVITPGIALALGASASTGLPVTFSLVSGNASLIGAILTLNDSNPAVIRATQTGSTNYLPASADLTLTPGARLAQSIAFGAPADRPTTASPFTLSASATSGLPVTFTINSGPAVISGNTLTLTGITGPVVVCATQPGNATYLAAPTVERTFSVTPPPAAPNFTRQPVSGHVAVGDAVNFEIAVAGFPTPTLQWRKNAVAVPAATNSLLNLGSVTIGSSGNYDVVATNSVGTAVSATAALVVSKRPQAIAFSATADTVAAGTAILLNATASSGLPVAYAVTAGNALMANGRLQGDGGTVVVRASQPGDSSYAAAIPVEHTFEFVRGGSPPFITSSPLSQIAVAGTPAEFTVSAIGTPTPVFTWRRNGIPLSVASSERFRLSALTLADAGNYSVIATNIFGAVTSAAATLVVLTPPTIIREPVSQPAPVGATVTLAVTAIGEPAPSYQWRKNAQAIPIANSATLTLRNITSADSASYDCVVQNSVGQATSFPAFLSVNAVDLEAQLGRERLTNVSTRATTGPEAATVIIGFTINGSAPLGLLIRAAGPALAAAPFNLTDALVNPQIQIFRGSLLIRENDDWAAGFAGDLEAAAARTGAFPFAPQSRDAALLTTLAPGGYTVHVTPSPAMANTAGGAVLAEIYEDPNQAATTLLPRLSNLSSRVLVTPTARVAIAGFVVAGRVPRRFLLRAAGPALAAPPFNLSSVLSDPLLRLFRGTTLIAENDDWFRDASAAQTSSTAAAVGAFPFANASRDAALIIDLEPGAYTVQITDAALGTGLVLIEIYDAGP